MSAVLAGLEITGGRVQLKGLPSSGLLDLRLDAAYTLSLQNVYLAKSSTSQYCNTNDYEARSDPLAFQHYPPKIRLCGDLRCLVVALIHQSPDQCTGGQACMVGC